MPSLVVMCGIPGSGKTTRAEQIAEYLKERHKCEVSLINEETLEIEKGAGYADATAEKITRGRLKFEVEKRLLGKTVVIIDSLNYIKGYRYQMFCIAREQKATYCVVFCNTPPEKALEFNKNSQKGFPEQLAQDLARRMEVPQLKNRWDVPLYERRDEELTPLEEIANTLLFEDKKSKDPKSTKMPEMLSEDYLYQVDKICQELCNQACLGKLKLKHNWSVIETRKIKNDFIGAVKEKPMPLKSIKEGFMEYLSGADKRK